MLVKNQDNDKTTWMYLKTFLRTPHVTLNLFLDLVQTYSYVVGDYPHQKEFISFSRNRISNENRSKEVLGKKVSDSIKSISWIF